MTSKIELSKNVVGRARSGDSFDLSVLSPEGSTLASASTGAANTATTGEVTVLPLSSGASYTLSEAPTPASGTRQADYSRSWSCTNNGVAEPSLPSGSGPSVAVSPQVGDFIACTVTNTQLDADLSVEKTASVESASAGDQITYTMVVENHGPSTADSTRLEDTLPAGLAYVSDDAGCINAAPPKLECELGTLASGEARTVHVVAQVQAGAAGSLQTNAARVGALQPDSEPANDESSASTPITPFADLAISKSVSPQVAGSLGQDVTFTLAVENRGENESSATVADDLPAGLAYVSDDGGCSTVALPKVECDLGALAAGATRTVHIVAKVESAAAGKANRNTATVSGSLFDPDPTNDEAAAILEVEPLSDLAVAKTTSATSVKPGETISYFLTAENLGPTTDPAVVIDDVLPPGLSYVSDNGGCDTSTLPELKCEIGVQEKGKSNTVTVVAEVVATSGTIENTAAVSGANPDADLANNESTATTPIEPTSDLTIAKTASAPSVKPGETLTYTLAVQNDGPADSESTTIADTLPADLTYVSDDGGCSVSAGREISCDLGTLASGAGATVHVLTQVAAATTGSIENTAAVAGANFDPDPLDNESTATTAVEPVADLAVAKSVSAPVAQPGEQLTYTLQVENRGPSTSSSTTVADALPPGLAYVSDDGGCVTAALPTLSCDLGSLASGATRTIHVVAAVTATAGSIENQATVDGPLPDPEVENDEASATAAVEPLSDLTIAKSAGAGAVKAGERLTYTLAVENKGPSDSSPTTVADTLPAQLTYVSDNAGCDTSALPTISCDLGNLAGGGSATIEIVTEVKAGASGEIENSAQVSGPNPDPEPGGEESVARTPIAPFAADLALAKTAESNGPVAVGETIVYTLAASNNGPDPSPETVVGDELPPGLAYVSDDGGCDSSALPKLECHLGTLTSGEARSVHVVARVAATGGEAIVNRASVSGANPDPVPPNNADSAATPVASPPPVASMPPAGNPPAASPPAPQPPQPAKHRKPKKKKRAGTPRLVLEKHAGRSFARPSAVIAYRITVWNKGDGDARKVKVCDEPPAQQKTLRTEPAVKNESAPCWHLDRLAAGKKRVFRLTAKVEGDSGAAVQRNRASVEAANVKGVRTDSAPVRVKPLPNTACGLRLLRPLGPPLALRC